MIFWQYLILNGNSVCFLFGAFLVWVIRDCSLINNVFLAVTRVLIMLWNFVLHYIYHINIIFIKVYHGFECFNTVVVTPPSLKRKSRFKWKIFSSHHSTRPFESNKQKRTKNKTQVYCLLLLMCLSIVFRTNSSSFAVTWQHPPIQDAPRSIHSST